MGTNSKTVQALWVAIGSLSSFALAILSGVILSRYFDKAEYGSYRQIIYIYNSLLVVFTGGLPKVYSFFLPRYSISEGKSITIKITKYLCIGGIAFSIVLYLLSDVIANILQNESLAIGLRVFSVMPFLLLPTLGLEGIFASYNKTIYIAIYNTVTRVVMLLSIVIPVIYFNGTYLTAIYGWIIASIFTLILSLYFICLPYKGIKGTEVNIKFREIFSYSLPIAVASVWGVAITSADHFFISRYFGSKIFAEFSNGFIQLPFVSMVTAAASVVLMPLLSKGFHEGQSVDDLMLTWRSVMQKSAIILYPLLIFFIAFAPHIIIILYSHSYYDSAYYFRINMILSLFSIIIFAPLFFSMGKTKVYSNIHLFLAIVIWSTHYIVLVVFGSPIAIAVNSTIWHILKTLYFIYLASKYMNVKFHEFFPIKTIILLIMHSVILVTLINECASLLGVDLNNAFYMVCTGVVFFILLQLTSSIFKINYLVVLQPLINKIKR